MYIMLVTCSCVKNNNNNDDYKNKDLSAERLRSLLADMATVCTSIVSTIFMISLGGTFCPR
jgi:hypothetical protein